MWHWYYVPQTFFFKIEQQEDYSLQTVILTMYFKLISGASLCERIAVLFVFCWEYVEQPYSLSAVLWLVTSLWLGLLFSSRWPWWMPQSWTFFRCVVLMFFLLRFPRWPKCLALLTQWVSTGHFCAVISRTPPLLDKALCLVSSMKLPWRQHTLTLISLFGVPFILMLPMVKTM